MRVIKRKKSYRRRRGKRVKPHRQSYHKRIRKKARLFGKKRSVGLIDSLLYGKEIDEGVKGEELERMYAEGHEPIIVKRPRKQIAVKRPRRFGLPGRIEIEKPKPKPLPHQLGSSKGRYAPSIHGRIKNVMAENLQGLPLSQAKEIVDQTSRDFETEDYIHYNIEPGSSPGGRPIGEGVGQITKLGQISRTGPYEIERFSPKQIKDIKIAARKKISERVKEGEPLLKKIEKRGLLDPEKMSQQVLRKGLEQQRMLEGKRTPAQKELVRHARRAYFSKRDKLIDLSRKGEFTKDLGVIDSLAREHAIKSVRNKRYRLLKGE